ncbi:MAG: hypothetical protein ACRD2A_17715 [Vicinamibacterales bacterium]
MQDALTVYFDGEKNAGMLLAGWAVAVLMTAVVIFRAGSAFRPFAVTLGVVAVAEIALGAGLYRRTGPQVARLEEQLRSAPAQYYADEDVRMARVQRNFLVIEYVELFVIVVASVAAVLFKGRPGVVGVALGLLISASILLAFDLYAERRGAEYVSAIADAQRGAAG